MRVSIIGLSQEMSFLTGEFHNVLRLQLPDGSTVLASADDAAVAKITALFVQGGGAAAQRAASASSAAAPPMEDYAPHEVHQARPMDDDGNEEFGGDWTSTAWILTSPETRQPHGVSIPHPCGSEQLAEHGEEAIRV